VRASLHSLKMDFIATRWPVGRIKGNNQGRAREKGRGVQKKVGALERVGGLRIREVRAKEGGRA
jgi:hypothetical protein